MLSGMVLSVALLYLDIRVLNPNVTVFKITPLQK